MEVPMLASRLKQRIVMMVVAFYEGVMWLLHPETRLRILTGRFLRAWRTAPRISQLEDELGVALEQEGDNSFLAKSLATKISRLRFYVEYGVTKDNRVAERIRCLQDLGIDETEVLYLLLNKLIHKDGGITINLGCERLFRMLGWVFFAGCAYAIVAGLIVVWGAIVSLYTQILLSVGLLIYFGGAALMMSCFLMLPKKLPLKTLYQST